MNQGDIYYRSDSFGNNSDNNNTPFDNTGYLAIESNPRLREMYARYEIPCFWITEEGTCLTEGTRIVKRLPR